VNRDNHTIFESYRQKRLPTIKESFALDAKFFKYVIENNSHLSILKSIPTSKLFNSYRRNLVEQYDIKYPGLITESTMPPAQAFQILNECTKNVTTDAAYDGVKFILEHVVLDALVEATGNMVIPPTGAAPAPAAKPAGNTTRDQVAALKKVIEDFMKNVNPNLQNDPRFKGLTDFLKTGRQGVVVPSPAAPSAAPAGAAAPASTTSGTASSGGSRVAVSSSGSTPTTSSGVVPSSSSAAPAPSAAPARSAPSAAPAASTPKPGVWSKLAGNPYLGSTVGAGLGALAGGLGLGGFGAAAGAKIGGAAGGAISNAYKSYKNSSNKGWKRFGDTLKGAGKGALKGLGIGSVASGVGGAVADGIGDYMSNQIPDDSIWITT
jgi:hypothetical protein